MYQTDLTIPANTPRTAPTEGSLTLNAGRLVRILVAFPPGCVNLARVAIHLMGAQIEPWNPVGYLGWDDYVYDIECNHEIPEGGTKVVVKGWNLDDTYQHTVHFGFEVVQEPEVTTESLLQRLLKAFVGE